MNVEELKARILEHDKQVDIEVSSYRRALAWMLSQTSLQETTTQDTATTIKVEN